MLSRPRSLRTYLALLVAASIVPVLAVSVYLLFDAAEHERRNAEDSLRRSALAIRVALDREIQIAVAALETLRHSRALAAGDLAAFEVQARAVKAQHPHWLGILLTRPDGQQLFNLAAAPGQPLPNIGHYEVIQAVVRNRAPAVSELMVGKVRPVPLVGIDVPVFGGNQELKYILGLSMPAAHIQKLLEQVLVLPGAVATIADYKDAVVAQSGAVPKPGEPAGVLAALAPGGEGLIRIGEGSAARVVAYSRARSSSWVATVSLPQAALAAAARRSIVTLLLGGAALLVLTFAAVFVLGRRIVSPIERLARSAADVVRGAPGLPAARGAIAEVEALESALRTAGDLQRRAGEEKQRVLETVQQSQKMEAVGRLTGGIAHDFNNLLAVIANSLAILERNPDPSLRRQTLDAVRRAADRGAALTRQLLVFARHGELNAVAVDVAAALGAMRAFLASSLRSDIAIELEVVPDVWPVHADAAQLDLAILNLALNARDAMPRGGTIVLAARNVAGGGGDRVRIEVRDNGAGMPPEAAARAFEPFFTTKPVGAGTGLGLAQVYGFARHCGGEAQLASCPGGGTTVSLLLPRARSAPASAGRAEARPGREQPGVRVMLVEDDDHVAWTTEILLREFGHAVARMRDARGALDALGRGDRFDLVVSDIVMPGAMSGIDFAREVAMRRPDLPVILVTAYSGAAGEAEGAAFRVLRKPYEASALAAAIDDALSARSARAA